MSAAITPTSSSEDEPNEFPREMKTFARHEYEHYKKHMKDNTQIFVENPHDPLHKFLDVCEATRRLREIKSTFEPDVGEVFLSGSNDLSALGDACAQGDMITKFQLFDTTQSKIVRVEAGGQVSFVLDERGRLFSWGSRDDGGLGRRIPEGDPFDLELSVERVRNFKPSNHALVKINKTDEDSCIRAVAAGGSHAICLTSNGSVYSFGAYVNDNVPLRELPPPDRPDNDDVTAVLYKGAAPFGFRPEPRHVWKMPQLVHKIAAGEAMSAAILVDETLVTWGRDIAGELGRHITEEQRDLLLQAKEDEDDENKKAHLGRMISDDFFTPKPVIYNPPIEGRYNVLNVACGAYHMLAVVRRGGSLSSAVYGCGNNILGQLGLGDTENRNVLTLIRDSENLCITSVAAGTNHSLFLNVTNNIYSCGDNAFGQLGLANEIIKNEYKTTLQPVPFGSKGREDFLFTSIVCGGDCSFAVSKTGKLFAWGSNLQGQLGHHDRSLRSANGKKFKMTQEFPRARLVAGLVEGNKFVLEASCGSKHTIVLARERTELDDNKPEWLVIGADEKGPK